MNSDINFRLAKFTDAEKLLACRNDELTRKASFNTEFVSYEEHKQWLSATLKDKKVKLYVVYLKDKFIGTIRSNLVDRDTYELSWSLMPQARGKGLAKDMLYLFLSDKKSEMQAYIKKENIASCKLAESIGMKLVREENEVLFYQKARK